ncbi:hypothetical protein TNCV_4915731 [Trichonephila clavipes]|nr:hypothetical protein TNCV_4915731 [Trichonephila clavipes]
MIDVSAVAEWSWSRTRGRNFRVVGLKSSAVEHPPFNGRKLTQSPPVDVLWKFGDRVPELSGLSSSLDRGTKLRSQLPITFVLLQTTRGLVETDHVILNHGQVTWTTPELAPPSPNYHTTPTGGRFSSRQI